jgi:hypothetical protein
MTDRARSPAAGAAGPANGAVRRPRPPGAAAAPPYAEGVRLMPEPDVAPPDLIADHAFDPWEFNSGLVICIHWNGLRLCERPPEEHARGPIEETKAG